MTPTDTGAIFRAKVRIGLEIPELTGELLVALDAYRASKAEFAAVTRSYERPGRHKADAETLASRDPRRQNAADFGSWYQGEITALGTALIALATAEEML